MKISLGPVQYYWPKNILDSYYQHISDLEIDIVYLGETVCNKRREYTFKEYINTAFMLREAGKEVVLSGIVLVESPADLRLLSKYCDNGEFAVEVNDLGAASILEDRKVPYVVGSSISCYNPYSLIELFNRGMRRWVAPVELSKEDLISIVTKASRIKDISDMEIEVLVLGNMPLAWSARCFTARSENRHKDECGLCCINYPEGRPVFSQDGTRLFTLNGLQAQSGNRLNLLNELSSMESFIDIARIYPDVNDDLRWIGGLRKKGDIPPPKDNDCNGYWFNMSGIVQV